jgi:hypothetical protein
MGGRYFRFTPYSNMYCAQYLSLHQTCNQMEKFLIRKITALPIKHKNWFCICPLHSSSRSDFGFEFAEIFVMEKRLLALVSRGVDKIALISPFFKLLNKLIMITSLAYFFTKLVL